MDFHPSRRRASDHGIPWKGPWGPWGPWDRRVRPGDPTWGIGMYCLIFMEEIRENWVLPAKYGANIVSQNKPPKILTSFWNADSFQLFPSCLPYLAASISSETLLKLTVSFFQLFATSCGQPAPKTQAICLCDASETAKPHLLECQKGGKISHRK